MNQDPVLVSVDGAVCTISLNLARKRNAVNRTAAIALRKAFEQFERDDSLSVAILTGVGGNFCAGADLKALEDPEQRNELDSEGRDPGPMGPSRMMFTKPVIAAVPGFAVAGGLELAAMCDIRIAETSTVFGVYCRRWGVPLIDGGTVRLPRIIGQGRALDMILTGRPVDAAEALQIGLANRVVGDGEALTAAKELAHQIAAFPQQCMNADRHSVYQQWDYELKDALRHEGAGGYPIIAQESIAGAQQFADGAGRHGSFK